MSAASILEHPGNKERLRPLTVEAYHALGEAGMIPERTELLYGFVFDKMPKSPIHSALAQRLRRLIEQILEPGRSVRQEQPVKCGVDSEPEPDLAVVVGSEELYWDKHPSTAELVIEIAVSSQDYDRDKADAYAGALVKEFWIVLVPEKQIEIYSDPRAGTYQQKRLVTAGQEAVSQSVLGFRISPRHC